MTKPDFLQVEMPKLLGQLTAESPAKWGQMTAQHMVEHIGMVFKLGTGTLNMGLAIPEEKVARRREHVLVNKLPFPRDLKLAVIPDTPPPYYFPSLQEAIQAVVKVRDEFYGFFQNNPSATLTHPVLGDLTFDEWEFFFVGHTRHHFMQFGLIEEDAPTFID